MSDLVGNPEDRFSRVAAQFMSLLNRGMTVRCKSRFEKMRLHENEQGIVRCLDVLGYEGKGCQLKCSQGTHFTQNKQQT